MIGPASLTAFDLQQCVTDGLLVPWSHRIQGFNKDTGAATYSTFGMVAPTTFGSSSASADTAEGPMIAHVTAASAGATAGVKTAYTIVRRDWSTKLVCKINTHTSIANTRLWIGLFSADPSGAATLGAAHGAAICYDSGVDGTAYWRTITSDGATETRTATPFSIAAATAYEFRIDLLPSTVEFYIGRTLANVHTATLPTATQVLGYQASVTALGAAARRIYVSRVAMTHI